MSRKRWPFLVAASVALGLTLWAGLTALGSPPQASWRFHLVAEGAGTIAGQGDWQNQQLQPYLVQIRRPTWNGFFWQVNTSRKIIEKVTNTTFGSLPNSRKTLNPIVNVNPPIDAPSSFNIQFSDAYISYITGQAKIAVYARVDYGESPVQISDGRDLEVKRLQPYLYHIRVKAGLPGNTPESWHWQVNTSRKEVWRVENGTFGQTGGTLKPTGMTVVVTGNPENPASFGLKFVRAYLWCEK
jgi:hypothetical protein